MSEATVPPGPEPRYERFDDDAGLQAAIDRLLEQEGRELFIFDPNLYSLRIGERARVANLERFLQGNRARRIQVAMHDTDFVTRQCPRLLDLLRRYSHAISLHRTHAEIRAIEDSFLVLDANHFVRRSSAGLRRGAIGLFEETEALSMRARFLEIWAASYPAVTATTLGI